jgi:hypothetical protein
MLVYHPPRPLYDTSLFVVPLTAIIDSISIVYPEAIFVACGDFNTFQIDFLCTDFGLVNLSNTATRKNSNLDKFFTQPYVATTLTCRILTSAAKTDHRAVYIYHTNDHVNDLDNALSDDTRSQMEVMDLKSHHIDKMYLLLAHKSWQHVFDAQNPDIAYNTFVQICCETIDATIPKKTVTKRSSDPSFITPRIRILLKKRNKLMRAGKDRQAESITINIRHLIDSNRKNALATADKKGAKSLWQEVNKIRQNTTKTDNLSALVNNVGLNEMIKQISGTMFDSACQSHHANITQVTSIHSQLNERQIYAELRKLRKTATGVDELPSWFLKNCAEIITPPLCHIFNKCLLQTKSPHQWKLARIHLIPKVNRPKTATDSRPIAVTPILSRVFERLVLKNFLFPNTPAPLLDDQYAFRPTTSNNSSLACDH